MAEDSSSPLVYRVVMNHEEQYSIWLQERELPAGWQDVGVSGTKASCLEHIRGVWVDMRPLSLRQQMNDLAANGHPDDGSGP